MDKSCWQNNEGHLEVYLFFSQIFRTQISFQNSILLPGQQRNPDVMATNLIWKLILKMFKVLWGDQICNPIEIWSKICLKNLILSWAYTLDHNNFKIYWGAWTRCYSEITRQQIKNLFVFRKLWEKKKRYLFCKDLFIAISIIGH